MFGSSERNVQAIDGRRVRIHLRSISCNQAEAVRWDAGILCGTNLESKGPAFRMGNRVDGRMVVRDDDFTEDSLRLFLCWTIDGRC
jgi:hypothetical protein